MLDDLKKILVQEAKKNETGNPDIDRNLTLKLHHSCRVQLEAEAIGRSENFTQDQLRELSGAALLHDISRFEQFRLHQSFDDRKSFDHGHRSVEIICQQKLLTAWSADAQVRILNAIDFHNKIAIPETWTGWERQLAEALRDADKIDIMKVLCNGLDDPAVLLDFATQLGNLSPEVYRAVKAGEAIRHDLLHSGCDFLAAKYQWAQELRFAYSKATFLQRGYFKSIRAILPDTAQLKELFELSQARLVA